MSKSSYSVSGFFFNDFGRGLKNADTAWHLNNQVNQSIGRGGYRTLRCNQGRQNKTDIRKKVISKYIQKTIHTQDFEYNYLSQRKAAFVNMPGWQRLNEANCISFKQNTNRRELLTIIQWNIESLHQVKKGNVKNTDPTVIKIIQW